MVALPSTAIITQSTVACQAAVFLLFHRERRVGENDESEKNDVNLKKNGYI